MDLIQKAKDLVAANAAKRKWWIAGGLAALLVGLTLAGAWQLWKPKPPTPEVAAPAARQVDDSLVLEKAPDSAARPAHRIPQGGTMERTMQVQVAPREGTPAAAAGCPPLTVDLSLVRNKDATRRVIASSPDGRVVGGLDVPVEAAKPVPEPKLWAAGIMGDPFQKTVGGFLDRDLGPARLGVEVTQVKVDDKTGWGTNLKLGIRF